MNRFALLTGCGLALVGLACRDDAPKPANAFATATPAPAGALPAGHPPTGGTTAGSPHAGASAVTAGTLSWAVPVGWRSEKPSSGMRRAQYKVPGPAGEAECVVFYFGPGEGGDAKANAERWAGQFTLEGGGQPALETSQLEGAALATTLVQVRGTYMGGMGSVSPEPQKGSALLGAIVAGPDANWFFKFVGPAATIDAARAAFVEMVKNAKPGA